MEDFDTIESLKEALDEANYDLEEAEDEIARLESEIVELEYKIIDLENDTVKETVIEILREHFFKFSPRKYDSYEKIIDALSIALRYSNGSNEII